VIEPEVGHDFFKLGVGIDVTDEALAGEFLIDDALGIFEGGDELLLRGVEACDQRCALWTLEGFAEGVELRLGMKARRETRCWTGRARISVMVAGSMTGSDVAGAAAMFIWPS
jgi:hypothetical protein